MPATFVAVNSYFTKKKRSHAVGISMVGTSLGQMIMPQVAQFLLKEYGYRGTTLILGALCMNGIPGAMLFQVTTNKNVRYIQRKIAFSPLNGT